MVFYPWSIWTNRLICTVIVPQRFWGHNIDLDVRDVTSSVTWPLEWQYMVSRRCSIWIHRLLRTVVEILSLKDTGITNLTFRVTWRRRLCDHWIPKVWFPIGSQYEPTMYLARLLRYWTSKTSGSGVTTLTFWGHVTPSITWPLDSQYGVSYRWSISSYSFIVRKIILVVPSSSSRARKDNHFNSRSRLRSRK